MTKTIMPVYRIKIPDKLWTTLLDGGILDSAPDVSKAAFLDATKQPHGSGGYIRHITGSSDELLGILACIRKLLARVHAKQCTAQQFNIRLRYLDRCAHQPLIRIKNRTTT